MKTSNKILLGLIIVVFSVPVLLGTNISNKVKKGEFTVVQKKVEREEDWVKGSFAPYKVVRVVSDNPQFMAVSLTASNEMSYKYYCDNDCHDSVSVTTVGETLTIQYHKLNSRDGDRNWYNPLHLQVNLPAIDSLIIDGATVIVDSFPGGTSNMTLVLKNRGELKDGTKKPNKDNSRVIIKKKKEPVLVASNEEEGGSSFDFSFKKLKKSFTADVQQMNIKEQLLNELIKGI